MKAHLDECVVCYASVVSVRRARESNDGPVVTPPVRHRVDGLVRDAGSDTGRAPRRAWRTWGAVVALLAAVAVLAVLVPEEATQERLRSSETSVRVLSVRGPQDGATVSERPTLRWDARSEAFAYRVTLYTNDGRVHWQAETEEPQVQVPPRLPMAAGTVYLWSVEAYLSTGRSVQSDLHAFTYAP